MAWFCSGTTNTELIENLWSSELIKIARVKQAMLAVSIFASLYRVTPHHIVTYFLSACCAQLQMPMALVLRNTTGLINAMKPRADNRDVFCEG
jgi:hypothetical protein